MEFVIITGMSGAGKSNAANALEDVGYYCIDNMPPSLIPPFAELARRGNGHLTKIAIVTDTRGGELFSELDPVLKSLKKNGFKYKLLFLDAVDETLVRRYKETRRKHPLGADIPLKDAVLKEREILRSIKEKADFVVDTTHTTANALKSRLKSLFSTELTSSLTIQCMSFGFKYGSVPEADLVFDVRCLPNPFYIDELRDLTGQDAPVRDFVLSSEKSEGLLEKLYSLLDYVVPLYCDEGKSQLVIAVGCTGGKHRSVVFAEKIYNHLLSSGHNLGVYHRDIKKVN